MKHLLFLFCILMFANILSAETITWTGAGGDNDWFNPEKNHLFERISYHDSAREAIEGSDVLYISTDWEEFRGLSRTIETTVKPPYLVIDGRRMIPDYNALVRSGYEYLPVGGVLLRPKPEKAVEKSVPNAEEILLKEIKVLYTFDSSFPLTFLSPFLMKKLSPDAKLIVGFDYESVKKFGIRGCLDVMLFRTSFLAKDIISQNIFDILTFLISETCRFYSIFDSFRVSIHDVFPCR